MKAGRLFGMRKWRVHFDRKLQTKQHVLSPGFGHPLAAAIAVNAFEALEVSAAIWEHGNEWLPLHTAPSPVAYEAQFGKVAERAAYNDRAAAEAFETKRTVVGQHAGWHDLFAPIASQGEIVGLLVIGPFGLGRPTPERLGEQWHWLTRRQAHLSDPGFSAFVDRALSVLVLEGDRLEKLKELARCLAALLGGEGLPEELLNCAEALRTEVEHVRRAERAWSAVHEMLDERSSHVWFDERKDLSSLGLPRMPDDVLVGLTASRDARVDPIGELVRRDAFQRAAVDLARRAGDALAGRVGEHGVVFLCPGQGSFAKRRRRLRDLADQATSLGEKKLGLRVHFGASGLGANQPLFRTFQSALSAAESATSQDARLVFAHTEAGHPERLLRQIRRDLGELSERRPAELGPRFDRYIEAVTARSSHRIEALRGYLDAGFDAVSVPLLRSGTLDEKSFASLCEALDQAAREARTSSEILSAYRRAVADVADAVRRPVPARHERSLRHALEHIERHYQERLRLAIVARVAAMAPARFSRLFTAREGVAFEDYVRARRIAQAKHLLANTGLAVSRVSEMSGFRSTAYFCRNFRAATGMTPSTFRGAPSEPEREGQKKVIKG
jgi:AraC-like DNA-binding protein